MHNSMRLLKSHDFSILFISEAYFVLQFVLQNLYFFQKIELRFEFRNLHYLFAYDLFATETWSVRSNSDRTFFSYDPKPVIA